LLVRWRARPGEASARGDALEFAALRRTEPHGASPELLNFAISGDFLDPGFWLPIAIGGCLQE